MKTWLPETYYRDREIEKLGRLTVGCKMLSFMLLMSYRCCGGRSASKKFVLGTNQKSQCQQNPSIEALIFSLTQLKIQHPTSNYNLQLTTYDYNELHQHARHSYPYFTQLAVTYTPLTLYSFYFLDACLQLTFRVAPIA